MAAAPVGWLRSRWDRLNGPSRVTGVDLARGLAVLGMFAAHLYAMPDLDVADASTWGGVVSGRSSILFATLAGVSIGLVTGGRTPVDGGALRRARGRLAVRAVLLWITGLLLIATGVPVYVILPAYGILFLLALPFLRLRATALFALAGTIALVMPVVQAALDALPYWRGRTGSAVALLIGWHYPFPVWIAFVLAGLGAARCGLMLLRTQVWLVAGGVVLAAIGYGLHTATGSPAAVERRSLWDAVWTARPHSTGLLETVGSGGFALATIGVCLLLCRTVLVWVVLPLRAVGAMPLTAYVGQLVVWAIIAAAMIDRIGDLDGFRALDPFPGFALTALVACTAWALLIGRGPLEWLVDRAARGIFPDRTAPAARGRAAGRVDE